MKRFLSLFFIPVLSHAMINKNIGYLIVQCALVAVSVNWRSHEKWLEQDCLMTKLGVDDLRTVRITAVMMN